PKGYFRVARLAASVAVKRGLLIDNRSRQWNSVQISKRSHRLANFGKTLEGHSKEATQFAIPLARSEIHQRGSRCRSDIGSEDAGEPVQKIGVGGSQAQAITPHCLGCFGHVPQNPSELRGRKIGVER